MLKYITNNVSKLTKNEKKHILGILINNTKYTKNSNGYLFDLADVDASIINKIGDCVKLILDNRVLIDQKDTERKVQLESYKKLIQDTLQQTRDREIQEWTNTLQLRDHVLVEFVKTYRYVESIDPDVLIRDHLESQKIKPGSRFYELNQIIKRLRKTETDRYREEMEAIVSNEDQDEVYEVEEDNEHEEHEEEHEEDNNKVEENQEEQDEPENDQDQDTINALVGDLALDSDTESVISEGSSVDEYRRLLSNFGLQTETKREELVRLEYVSW